MLPEFAGTYIVTEGRIGEGDYIELDGGPAGFVLVTGWPKQRKRPPLMVKEMARTPLHAGIRGIT